MGLHFSAVNVYESKAEDHDAFALFLLAVSQSLGRLRFIAY